MYGNGSGAMVGYPEECNSIKGGRLVDKVPGDAKREPELPEQLSRLARSVDYLLDSMNALDARLSPVMQPSPPQAVGNTATAGPTTSYANAVHEQSQRIMNLGERMSEWLRRLEV